MNNKYALLFCFDNISQLKYFNVASLTINESNFSDFDILLLTNDNVRNDKNYNESIIKLKSRGANVIEKSIDNKNIPGMFYWIISPLLFDYEKIIQLDVDMVFGPKTKFINLINENLENDKSLSGYRAYIQNTTYVKNILSKYLDVNENELTDRSYINSGVVLMDTIKIKYNLMFHSKNELEREIIDYVDWCKKTGNRITDQEFLFVKLENEIGFINKNWNVRFWHKIDVINYNDNDDFVFHYNVKILDWTKMKMRKVNYTKYFNLALKNDNWKIYSRANKKYMFICKPSFWFPFKKFTNIGDRDKQLYESLNNISKKIIENIERK